MAAMLDSRGYDIELIRKTSLEFAEEPTFPSAKDFISAIKSNKYGKPTIKAVEVDFQAQLKKEYERHQDIRRKFVEALGEAKIKEYINFWYAGTFGRKACDALTNFGLTLSTFEKSALFDWAEANGDPKLSINLSRKKINKEMINWSLQKKAV